MKEKNIILGARVMSMIFTPFYLPLVGLIALFIFSYMSLMPLEYKAFILLLVYIFTILLPSFLIHIYRKYQGWTPIELGKKERRIVPYIISIICYFSCLWLMNRMHVPRFMGAILLGALVIQMTCALINVWWKISTHTAAIGGVAGALLAFAEAFSFNPMWWLCIVILMGGIVGSSRIILRQHSLSQVLTGFCVGLICSFPLLLHIL